MASGQVKTAFMFVGGNDFLDAAISANAQTLLPQVPQTLLTNVLTSANTLLAASPSSNVIIANVFDVSLLPIVQQAEAAGLVTPTELQGITKLVNGYNQALSAAVSKNPRLGLVDMNGLAQQILAAPTFTVDGVNINRTVPSDQYTHLFLADGLHIGTVGQGLLANAFISVADSQFKAGISPLTPAELIKSAQSVPTAIPLPRTWEMGIVGLLIAAVVARGYRVKAAH
jgi:hypothetical protein